MKKDVVLPDVDTSDLDADLPEPLLAGEKSAGHQSWNWLRCRPGHYARAWELLKDSWEVWAEAYEADPADFYNSFHYLDNHPIYWSFEYFDGSDRPLNHLSRLAHGYGFYHGVSVDVVRVNPLNETIEERHPELNTSTRVWLETGKRGLFYSQEHHTIDNWHDYELDCGAPTYEGAVILLAHNVWERYGNDRRVCDASK